MATLSKKRDQEHRKQLNELKLMENSEMELKLTHFLPLRCGETAGTLLCPVLVPAVCRLCGWIHTRSIRTHTHTLHLPFGCSYIILPPLHLFQHEAAVRTVRPEHAHLANKMTSVIIKLLKACSSVTFFKAKKLMLWWQSSSWCWETFPVLSDLIICLPK